MKTKKEHIETITAEEFDRRFDAGEDVSQYIDWSKATQPGLEIKRMSLDLPAHMLWETRSRIGFARCDQTITGQNVALRKADRTHARRLARAHSVPSMEALTLMRLRTRQR
jgi:phage baseplate assembly protein W